MKMGRNDDRYRNERDEQHQSASTIADELRPSTIAFIYRSEMDYISRCIRDYPNIETGGQLFGFFTEYGAPVVCFAIGPGPRANHQPTFFNQDTGYLQNTYNELNRRYGLRYIGEWHSHHQLGLAKPSGHDASTVVHGMQKNSFRHFLLCIGNCDNHFHSTLNAFTFHLDDPYNYYHAPWKIVEMESPYRAIIDREMRDVLCHPRTRQAGHGSNYILTETSVPMMVTPDYSDEYWLNQKSNNLILKKIMDFLTKYEEGSTVKPMLDGQKRVHLMVQRANRQEQIVFGDRFPYEMPEIKVSEGVYVNDFVEWQYEWDIYGSFVQFYKDCFKDVFECPESLIKSILVYNSKSQEFEPEYKVYPNQKNNNLVLKDIIGFLKNYDGVECTVKTQFDSTKHVQLTIQRANRQEQIVFGEVFPYMAPTIEVSEGVYVNNSAEWDYKGDVFESFVSYYEDFFKKKATEGQLVNSETDAPKDSNPYEFMESVVLYPEDLEKIKNSSQSVFDGYATNELFWDYVEGLFSNGVLLHLRPSVDTAKNNVLFFRGKAVDYKPNTYVVEDVQSEYSKAFYVEEDGAKRELVLKLL